MQTKRTVCTYDELLSEVAAGRPDAYYPEMISGNTAQCYIVRDTAIKGSPIVCVAAPVGHRLKLASSLGEPTYSLQAWDIYIRVGGLPEDHTKFTLSSITPPTNSWPYMLPEPLRNCDSARALKKAVISLGGYLMNSIQYINTSKIEPNRNPVDVEMIIGWEDTFVRPCLAEGGIPDYLKVQCKYADENKQCILTCPHMPRYASGAIKQSAMNNLVKKTPITIKVSGIRPGDLYIYSRDEYSHTERKFERSIGFIRALPCYAAFFKHGIPSALKESYLLQENDIVYIPAKKEMDVQPSELIIPISVKNP